MAFVRWANSIDDEALVGKDAKSKEQWKLFKNIWKAKSTNTIVRAAMSVLEPAHISLRAEDKLVPTLAGSWMRHNALASEVQQLLTESERVKEAVSLTSERKSIKGKTNECAVLANSLQESFAEQLQWLAVLSAAQLVDLQALHREVRLPFVEEKVKRDPEASISLAPSESFVFL